MLQEIVGHLAEQADTGFVAGVAVGQRHAVHAPRLPPRPGGTVPVALAGGAAQGRAGLGVKEEGVVGGVVGPHQVLHAGPGVGHGDVAVMRVAGDFAGPVEQRQVQQAVDDEAVVVGGVVGAPGLDELPFFPEAAAQLIGGQQGGLAAGLAAGELIGRHAGGRVQEAHVVVVHVDLALDAVQEAVHLAQGRRFEGVVAGVLPGQPVFAGAETGGPLHIVAGRVEVVFAVGTLEFVGKFGQIAVQDAAGRVQGGAGGFVGELFHGDLLLRSWPARRAARCKQHAGPRPSRGCSPAQATYE